MGQLEDECGHNAEAISETEAELDSEHTMREVHNSQPTAGGAAGLTYMSKSGRTEQFTPVIGEQNEEVIKDYVTDCGNIISAYKLFTVILITLLLTPLQFDERFKIPIKYHYNNTTTVSPEIKHSMFVLYSAAPSVCL